jgi:hypothetical protein
MDREETGTEKRQRDREETEGEAGEIEKGERSDGVSSVREA